MNAYATRYTQSRALYLSTSKAAAEEIRSLPPMDDDATAEAIRDIRMKYGLPTLAEKCSLAEAQLSAALAVQNAVM